jgi:hypothetical protein
MKQIVFTNHPEHTYNSNIHIIETIPIEFKVNSNNKEFQNFSQQKEKFLSSLNRLENLKTTYTNINQSLVNENIELSKDVSLSFEQKFDKLEYNYDLIQSNQKKINLLELETTTLNSELVLIDNAINDLRREQIVNDIQLIANQSNKSLNQSKSDYESFLNSFIAYLEAYKTTIQSYNKITVNKINYKVSELIELVNKLTDLLNNQNELNLKFYE